MRKIVLGLVFVTQLAVCLFGTISYAKKIDKRLDITPSIALRRIYDSNLFKVKESSTLTALRNDDRMYDFFTILSTGLALDYPISKQRVSIDGKRDFVRYTHYNSQDYDNESLQGNAELNLAEKIRVSPSYAYSSRVIPRTHNTNRSDQDFLRRRDTGIGAEYRASQWKVSIGLKKSDYDYKLRDNINRGVDTLGTVFTLIPSGSSEWRLEFRRRDLTFADTSLEFDNREEDILVGASFILTGRNRLKIEGGVRGKSFSTLTERGFKGFIGKVSLSHKVSRDTLISTLLSRSTETSYFTNTTYYVIDTIRARFSWHITDKINSDISARQKWINFKGGAGSTLLQWHRYLVLGYELEYRPYTHTACTLSYDYQQRASNRDSWEFEVHTIMTGVSLAWE